MQVILLCDGLHELIVRNFIVVRKKETGEHQGSLAGFCQYPNNGNTLRINAYGEDTGLRTLLEQCS